MKFAVKAGKLIFRMQEVPKEVVKERKESNRNLAEACPK
jgi:hypothetical protein